MKIIVDVMSGDKAPGEIIKGACFAAKTGKMLTCEEHSIIGGLGGAVCETVSEQCPCIVKRIGIEDRFGVSGKAMEVAAAFGLSTENITEKAKELARK